LFLSLSLLCARPGQAGNLEKFFLGEDAGLTAGAVDATTADSGSLYYNPAGLALLQKDSVDLGISAYAARYYRVPGIVQLTLPDRHAAIDFTGTSFFSTPAAVVFGSRLSPSLGYGLAVFTRDQLDVAGLFSQKFSGMNGANPYEYEQSVSLDFRAKDYLAGMGLGWQAARPLRLGLTVLGEYSNQSVGTEFLGDFLDPSSYNPGTQLYGTRLTTSFRQHLGVGVYGARAIGGLQWQISPALALGFVARSPVFVAYENAEIDFLLDGNIVPGPAVIRIHVDQSATSHPYIWADPWRLEGALAWTGERGWVALQGDASDRPDDEGRGAIWNFKLGGLLHLNRHWDYGAGVYSDQAWNESLPTFGSSNLDYYGANTGLRWRRQIGAPEGQPGAVELSTSLLLHYERGYGQLAGAGIDAAVPNFPLPVVKTAAIFEEANIHLASGLAW
jgi:hypothetical protein